MAGFERIAVVVDRAGAAQARAVLRGIVSYARPGKPWVFHTIGRSAIPPAALLRAWEPSGVIADLTHPELADVVSGLGVPLVEVSRFPRLGGGGHAYVGLDHVAIGSLVGGHFSDRGLRHFAYFGLNGDEQDRLGQYRGLSEAVAPAVPHLTPPNMPPLNERDGWASTDAFLAKWLKSLPKPCGLMLSDDVEGLWLTQPCLEAGLRVPEDLALVGVYDNETNCRSAWPELSSVAVPGERIGYEAAALLDQMMGGAPPPPAPLLLPPIGVTTRHSSDLLAIDDPDVAEAIRYIRLNAHRPLRVEEVVTEVAVSSRLLERRFRTAVGRSPAEEIRRVRVELAKQLLIRTDLPLRTVAQRSGFADVHHLCHAFRRDADTTPARFREQFRTRG
ncbi:MAG TPA: substrate-binding domain-containing protein [Tepidisphaeraceae bacterium]|nr:substrate-binding domain-containing protein [Tepidisphaeraceae bacterium]